MQNRLLASLSREDVALLELSPIELTYNQVLLRAGEPIERFIFIEEGLVVSQLRMEDGRSAEVGLITADGVVGLSLLFAPDTSFKDYLVVLSGHGLASERETLRRALRQSPRLMARFVRARHAAGGLDAQIAGCNRLHDARQRFARLMLLACGRDPTEPIKLDMRRSQIAEVLGISRVELSRITSGLRRRGVLNGGARKHIDVTDRAALLAMSCECYDKIQGLFNAL